MDTIKLIRIIRSVTDWRTQLGISQGEETHLSLLKEEEDEWICATNREEMADALADRMIVAVGYAQDCPLKPVTFTRMASHIASGAVANDIDILEAVSIAMISNWTKVCPIESCKSTEALFLFRGVKTTKKYLLDGVAYFSAEDQVGDNGKFYKKGKLLKPLGFKEPDWKGNTKWDLSTEGEG